MSIEEVKSLTKFEMLPDGRVQLRWTTVFVKDGVAASKPAHHREIREPASDISDLPHDLQASIKAYWTPSRVADWLEIKAAQSETILE